MRNKAFARPSAEPDFLHAQEGLESGEREMLATLRGTLPSPAPSPAPRAQRTRAAVAEDRSHRTTIWLSPSIQRQIRIRALERQQTVSAYLLELLARDGIKDT